MTGGEYRDIIRKIVRSAIKKHYPSIRVTQSLEDDIARNVHARMYGANVDGVESSLWRSEEPKISATEILKGEE